MNQRTLHLLEKIQIQLATVLAGVAVYLAAWPAVRPWDVHGPVAFLANSEVFGAVAFALIVWLVAAATAPVTVRSRPEGTLVATLLACGALSIRSPQIRSLLWRQTGDIGGMYVLMMVETVLMAAVLVAAVAVVAMIRSLLATARPNWLWRDPLEHLGGEPASHDRSLPLVRRWLRETGMLLGLLPRASGLPVVDTEDGRPRRPESGAGTPARAAACMALALVTSLALLWVLMQSAERGQILFAILASFTLAALLAHQVLPSKHGMLVWILPFVVAAFLYAIAAGLSLGDGPLAWSAVPLRARALPIDWLTAGAGGAYLGYWLSARIHEMRFIEKH